MTEPLAPNCPLCGSPPLFVFGSDQAFCSNRDSCTLILWNPSLSLDDNLLDAGVVHLPGEGPGGLGGDCDYCAGYRCDCTCESDCGARPGGLGADARNFCPHGDGYAEYLRGTGLYSEAEIARQVPAAGTEASDGE